MELTLDIPEGADEDSREEIRQRIRNQCMNSTYFLGKAVLGFKDFTSELHHEMADAIQTDLDDRKKKRFLGLVPRDNFKTSLWTITDSVRRIARNPDIRILLGNETATNAAHFLRRIQAVWTKNGLFRWLFPETVPDFGARDTKWSESEMLVRRPGDFPEATIEAIGVGGAVVSRHYNLIKLDDLVGKAAGESPEIMKDTVGWYQYTESLLEDPVRDEIHVVGTRWTHNDLYRWILDNEKDDVDFFFRSCFKEDGSALWPERFSLETLERLKRKMGTFKFSCQYLNDPRDPDQSAFDRKWLRFWKWESGRIHPRGASFPVDIENMRRFMRVDPAISERPGAARSAIVVDGVAPDSRIFLLEAWAKRCQPFEMIDKIFDFARIYNVESIAIEAVAYQRILKPVIEAESIRRGCWLNIIEVRPDSREKKENRIRGGLQPYLERGLIWIREDMEDWLEEYDCFPTGKTLDLLDATAYGPQQWYVPLEDENKEDIADELQMKSIFEGRSELTGY